MVTKGQLALKSVRLLEASAINRYSNTRHFHYLSRPLPSSRISTSRSIQLPPSPTLRFASTSRGVAIVAESPGTRLKNLFLGSAIGLFLLVGYYYVTDTRAGIHQWVVVPSLRWIYDDAEEAHEVGTKALKDLYGFGLHPRERGNGDAVGDLKVEVFGHVLSNPIGTSAGIDKHAEIPSPLLAIGPSVIEVGGATPYPQDGNPKPRVFRMPSQKALINRYGLNSEGADSVAMRLRQRVREYAYAMGFGLHEDAEQRVLDGEAGVPPGSLVEGKLMAVQVAKNKFTPDNDIEAVKRDYVYCVEALARYADIIVVNVSSPNTPGLRGLQRVEPLMNILTGVVEAAKKANRKTTPAVMVKVSPDEDSDEQVSGICDAVWESGVDGVIVGNTTKRRPGPLPAGYTLPEREARILLEQGGYSGPQLFERTVSLVKRYRKMLDERGQNQTAEPSTPPKSSPQSPKSDKTAKPVGGPPSAAEPERTLTEKIEATIQRDKTNLKELGEEAKDASKSQPLIRLPARNDPSTSEITASDRVAALSPSTHLDQLPPKTTGAATSPSQPHIPAAATPSSPSTPPPTPSPSSASSPSQQKVIFATGGITNGKQALEVLNAGASVAMVYTALVYGGVGTISRIKGEMKEEMGRIRRSGVK